MSLTYRSMGLLGRPCDGEAALCDGEVALWKISGRWPTMLQNGLAFVGATDADLTPMATRAGRMQNIARETAGPESPSAAFARVFLFLLGWEVGHRREV